MSTEKMEQALRIKFENWALDQSNITSEENCLARDRIDGRYVYRHVETAWRAYLAAHESQAQAVPELLECDIKPRPLSYPLADYHRAMTDGPLHYTWEDKPHRLVYDLIAAVKHYAAPQPGDAQ